MVKFFIIVLSVFSLLVSEAKSEKKDYNSEISSNCKEMLVHGDNCKGQQSKNPDVKSIIKSQSSLPNQIYLFEILNEPIPKELAKNLVSGLILNPDVEQIQKIYNEEPKAFSIQIPLPNGAKKDLVFHKRKIVTDGFKVRTSDGKILTGKSVTGVHYQIDSKFGSEKVGTLSFTGNEFSGLFSDEEGNWNIGKLPNGNGAYILFCEKDLKVPSGFHCETEDVAEEKDLLEGKGFGSDKTAQAAGSCRQVKIYLECDYKMYQDNGSSVSAVSTKVASIFNNVQQLYQNEQVNVILSEVFVWTVLDPYALLTSSNYYLSVFGNTRTTFNGDIAQLLSTRNTGMGGIAYLNGLCSAGKYSFCNIFNTFSAVPTYSWTVEVMTHELGHGFGSRHTHWCGWQLTANTIGRIDSCFDGEIVTGAINCSNTRKFKTNGSIMSYCHLTGGISFNVGFGPLPGKVIRDRFASVTCLSSAGCLASASLKVDSATNFDRNFILTISIPASHGASSWSVNEGGVVVSSGNLSNQLAINIDVPVTNRENGTYSFTASLASGANTNTNSSTTVIISYTGGTSIFSSGNLVQGTETICNGGDPANIVFSAAPTSGSNYQWYVKNGIVNAPANNDPITGWSSISGAVASNYNPPSGLALSQTFACRVSKSANSLWASGVWQVSVLPAFNPGVLTSGDESFCTTGNPANITLSSNPVGSGAYQYRWYFRETSSGNCATGRTIGTEWNTNNTSPNISGTSLNGSGLDFDPMSAGEINVGRTFALYITPIANGSIPACGTPQWATNCRKTFVTACLQTTFTPGEISAGNQTICNAGDPESISFSTNATSGSSFQWFFQSGLIDAPANTASLTGWTAIMGASVSTYDPQAGLASSRTYACRVSNGVNSQWATKVRQVVVLPAFNPGSLTANQSGCPGFDPNPVTLSTPPTGSGAFQWRWYYVDNTTGSCPSGSNIPNGGITSQNDSRFFGTSLTGSAISFDAMSAGSKGRTWSLLITPIANGKIPACGLPQFTNTCHKTMLALCQIEENPEALPFESEKVKVVLSQNMPNPWNGETKISYNLAGNKNPGRFVIYSVLGKLIYEEQLRAETTGDIILKEGKFSNGFYSYKLIFDNGEKTSPMKFYYLGK